MSVPENYNMGVLGELFESTKVLLAILLLVSGIGMLIVGVLAGTTSIFTSLLGMGVYESWRLAGICAGLGVPLMIVGVFTVLPATKHQRLGAAVGLGLVGLGVFLFSMYFPNQWYGDPTDNTLLVVGVYFVGALLTITYLFLSVANLQTPTEQQYRSRRSRARRRSRSPQTASALVKGVIGLALSATQDDDDGAEQADDVDLEKVKERLESELADEIEEAEIVNDHVVIERQRDVTHAQFTTALPQYVDLVDRDEKRYALAVDAVSFRLLE